MAQVTVTADFGRADETPAQGRVLIAPWLDAVRVAPDPQLVTRARLDGPLDDDGLWTGQVIPSDDPAWQTDQPVPYLVTWQVSGSYGQRIVVIPSPGPWSLWELVDIADPPTIVPTPIPGPQGEVAVDSTVTGDAGTDALVEDLDPSPSRALLRFTIPRGDKGDQGEVSVVSTTTGNPGTAAAVTDSDPSPNRALLKFTIPRGDKGDQGEVSVASTVTGNPGTSAAVTDSDPSPNRAALNFTIPRGDKGDQGEVAVDSAVTGAAGTAALVEDLDPSPNRALLKFTIPRGDKGDQGEVSVTGTTTGNPGTAAAVVDTDPSPNRAALDFTIPRGTVVAVGPTVTGNPGTAAAVVDGDPGVDVRLDFTVPRGDVGATGPAIGAILTTKGDLAVRDAATAVRLPVGADGSAVIASSAAATGLRYAPVGNMLTENQASVETDLTGLVSGLATFARVAGGEHGSYCLEVTATGASPSVYVGGTPSTSAIPVTPGRTYTARVRLRAASVTRTAALYGIYWRKADGTTAASTPTSFGTNVALSTSWQTYQVTAAAPADAAFASFRIVGNSFGVGETFQADMLGFWAGAGGDWAMPGTPITGLQSAWEQVALLADLPATGNWPGRKIQVTSGLGLQVMVWTGIAWAVDPVSDTGERTWTPINGFAGTVKVRRIGQAVTWTLAPLDASAKTAGRFYTTPVGWRAAGGTHYTANAGGNIQVLNEDATGWLLVTGTGFASIYTTMNRITSEAWPTVAP